MTARTATPSGQPLARRPVAATATIRVLLALLEGLLVLGIALLVLTAVGIVGNPWYQVMRVEGGSMAPTIPQGDLIVVTRAPARIEPGMVLVMAVDGAVVTHRVVAVNADGTFVTRGDANAVNDAWGRSTVEVEGLYVATIPWLGHILPLPWVSEATFVDRTVATMEFQVGTFPAQGLAAIVRIEPQTINLSARGDVTAFVEGLPAPHGLGEIDLASVQLCYHGACIASDGPARRDGAAQVAARFTRAGLAGIVGPDRGELALVVQGILTAGGTFSGQDTNRVIGGTFSGGGAGGAGTEGAGTGGAGTTGSTGGVGPLPGPTDSTSSPDPAWTPGPTDGAAGAGATAPAPTDTAAPAPSDGPASSPGANPLPGGTGSPPPTPAPSPSPAPTPTDGSAPSALPSAGASADPTPSPPPTPDPTATPNVAPTAASTPAPTLAPTTAP